MYIPALNFKTVVVAAAITSLAQIPMAQADTSATSANRKPPGEQIAVICAQNGNCLHVRKGITTAQAEPRQRRSPLWFLEELFFN